MKILPIVLLFFAGLNAEGVKFSARGKSAILFNPDTGAILYEKGAREPRYPASTMKIATALYVLDNGFDLEKPCKVSDHVLETIHASTRQKNVMAYPSYILEHDGVKMGLISNKTYPLKTLVYGLLLNSANDAANTIAQSCSGSVDNFMQDLNIYLKKKGIENTKFQNPHGLYHPAQLTTAYDMAKIAALAFENKKFREIIKSKKYEWSQGVLENWNKLIEGKKYFYPKALGGKTGYTESSGFNLVAAAEHEGRRLIAVLFGYEVGDDRFKDAISLFELAFSEKEKNRILFSKGDHIFTHDVIHGRRTVKAAPLEDVNYRYFPAEEGKLQAKVIWDRVVAPIKIGQKVGELVVGDSNRERIASTPICAIEKVGKTRLFQSLDIAGWLGGLLLIAAYFFKKRSKFFKR